MLKKLKKWIGGLRPGHPSARFAAIDAALARRWSVSEFDALRKLAESGCVEAQLRLGQMFERGEGVVQSVVDAVHWYRAAAAQDCSPAHERLGLIYFIEPLAPAALSADTSGELTVDGGLSSSPLARFFPLGLYVGQDYEESARWNGLAAAAGNGAAQARLGHQCAVGLGVERDLAAAQWHFAAAADRGDTAGARGLGILLAGGYGEEGRDDHGALRWLTVAAEAEDAIAQRWLGGLLMRADGAVCDPASAVVWFERAAQQGDAESMVSLGLAFRRGHGVSPDLSVAESWLRRAATRGNSDAACALGQLILDLPENDGIEAAQWLRQAAENGHRRAAAIIAHLHLLGHGLPKNLLEAERWLHLAGSESEPESYTQLAWLHSQDSEGVQDFAAAAKWLTYAAERGSVDAQYNLGSLYRLGQGVERDLETAARYYRRAAEAGKAEGAFHLGLLCAAGDGVEQDFEEAVSWFARASEAGHLSARCNLAFLMLEGRGVAADPAQATALLESAAAEGSVEAAEALFKLSVDMHNVPTDAPAAVGLVERAVNLGSAMGMEILADWLFKGEYLPRDPRRGRTLLEQAANLGHARAQVALGRLLAGTESGDEAPDPVAARLWFERAAEQGDADAQAWMGDCCRLGLIDEIDNAAAEQWYRKAAAQNHEGSLTVLAKALEEASPQSREIEVECFGLWLAAAAMGNSVAQRMVGQKYLLGRGCDPDEAAAVRWLEASAQQGDVDAAYDLACCLRDGTGIDVDVLAAKRWFKSVADVGYKPARVALNRLRSNSGKERMVK